MPKRVPLSQRIRPNTEAAPWVIEEVKQLEGKIAAHDAILEAVRREMQTRKPTKPGNGPDHGHSVPGVWDEDNGPLSGQPCAMCMAWRHFTALIEQGA